MLRAWLQSAATQHFELELDMASTSCEDSLRKSRSHKSLNALERRFCGRLRAGKVPTADDFQVIGSQTMVVSPRVCRVTHTLILHDGPRSEINCNVLQTVVAVGTTVPERCESVLAFADAIQLLVI